MIDKVVRRMMKDETLVLCETAENISPTEGSKELEQNFSPEEGKRAMVI